MKPLVTFCRGVTATLALTVAQAYSDAHISVIDAIARHDTYQQVTWYACAPIGNDMAAIVLAFKLARDCLSIKVDDADSGYYGPAFLMKPSEAAGHISIELCDHVLNTTLFMACLSPIMQVA